MKLYGSRLHRWDIERRRGRWDPKGTTMAYPPTGLDFENSRTLTRIADTLQGIHFELRRIADRLDANAQAPEDPPLDLSWVQTEDIKRDYGRDPRD